MLSFLYRLVTEYRHTHGFLPNRVEMNPDHYQALLRNLAGMEGEQDIARFLMMDILISTESVHPHVSWSEPAPAKQTVAM
jgi:hypothetical protein